MKFNILFIHSLICNVVSYIRKMIEIYLFIFKNCVCNHEILFYPGIWIDDQLNLFLTKMIFDTYLKHEGFYRNFINIFSVTKVCQTFSSHFLVSLLFDFSSICLFSGLLVPCLCVKTSYKIKGVDRHLKF